MKHAYRPRIDPDEQRLSLSVDPMHVSSFIAVANRSGRLEFQSLDKSFMPPGP
jgi:hypothetical protein